jgi:hypothetical protein
MMRVILALKLLMVINKTYKTTKRWYIINLCKIIIKGNIIKGTTGSDTSNSYISAVMVITFN